MQYRGITLILCIGNFKFLIYIYCLKYYFYFPAGPPRITLSFGPSYVEMNKNITLPTCHVTSFPLAVVTWSKVLGELMQSKAVVHDGQLSIVNAQKKHSGLYKCKASNKLGHDLAGTQLNVVELPRFQVSPPANLEVGKNRNITIPCQATGDPQPKVMWMKENGELLLLLTTNYYYYYYY